MSIFENILKLGLILVSYVFYLNCNSPNSSPQFISIQESLFPSPFHFGSLFSFGLTDCLLPQVNLDVARLRLPPHTVASLHPPVTPPCGKQEPSHVLLSPFEMGADPSSLLPKMEELKNSTHCRPFLLHGTISPPSSALQKASGSS
jgi:hypothetical protein